MLTDSSTAAPDGRAVRRPFRLPFLRADDAAAGTTVEPRQPGSIATPSISTRAPGSSRPATFTRLIAG